MALDLASSLLSPSEKLPSKAQDAADDVGSMQIDSESDSMAVQGMCMICWGYIPLNGMNRWCHPCKNRSIVSVREHFRIVFAVRTIHLLRTKR